MMKTLVFVAAAAMGLTACQNDFEEQIEAKDSVVVTFVADSADNRTSVNTEGETPTFAWGENETFAVLEQTDALAAATTVTYAKDEEGKAEITATFDTNAGKESYQYVTVYPATGYVSAESIEAATLTLPAEQTMAEGSYDPNADLMVSKVVATTAQPTEAQMVQFTRLAAVAKMSFKGFVDEGETVESLTFTTAEDVKIAGTITADLTAPAEWTVANGTNSITVTSANGVKDVYFTLLPATIAAEGTYSVIVVTDKKIYKKDCIIPEGKSLKFAAGMVTRFGVDLEDVTASDKWVLVRDASTLEGGDIVTIVAKDYDKAISKKLYNNGSETATNTRRDAVDITKYQNYLIANENVQPFILVSGTTEGTFSFYDEDREKFLVSNNTSSRYLINQEYISDDTSFAFTIDLESGDATIKNTVGEYTGNMIRYYNSSKYFYSGTSENQAVCVYKLAGAVGTVPVVAANVTVPEADEYVVVAEEGVAEATAIEEVVFNYVGDWIITATSAAEWLKVTYDATKNCLTYTAEQNTSAKRETTVTIKATLEGQEPLSWTFNVLQKGAPQDITIAEFVKLVKDENSTYRITGRITEMTTSSSGTFKLTDGTNVATVTYLYTDGGVKVSGNTEIGVAVGDVMTVTTVPVGSGKGGNSSHYSIYKGHYGFKTTLGIAAGYTGGDVTISVETYSNGSIVVPEAVVATMAESDFATLSYSGGDTATVTFTSENTTTEAREVEVTFTYGLASVTVIAQQGINPANKLGYELVTDASTLSVGDEVIIVAATSDKALGCLASTSSATSVSTIPAVDVVKSGNVIYDVEEAGVMLLTLKTGLNEGEFAFQFTHKDTDYYINAPSSGLKGRAASSGANNSTSYALTIDASNGFVTMQSTYPRIVKFNSKTGTNFTAFKLDAEGATLVGNDICIYKKQVSK